MSYITKRYKLQRIKINKEIYTVKQGELHIEKKQKFEKIIYRDIYRQMYL